MQIRNLESNKLTMLIGGVQTAASALNDTVETTKLLETTQTEQPTLFAEEQMSDHAS